MLNLKQYLKKITSLIKQLSIRLSLIVDFIIEENTIVIDDTTWHYCKYFSGKCKMIGYRESLLLSTDWITWGNGFYFDLTGRTYPFTLTKLYEVKTNTFPIDNGGYILVNGSSPNSGTDPTLTNTGKSCVVRLSKITVNTSIKIVYTVIGEWK